jgi:hypothetical protein
MDYAALRVIEKLLNTGTIKIRACPSVVNRF